MQIMSLVDPTAIASDTRQSVSLSGDKLETGSVFGNLLAESEAQRTKSPDPTSQVLNTVTVPAGAEIADLVPDLEDSPKLPALPAEPEIALSPMTPAGQAKTVPVVAFGGTFRTEVTPSRMTGSLVTRDDTVSVAPQNAGRPPTPGAVTADSPSLLATGTSSADVAAPRTPGLQEIPAARGGNRGAVLAPGAKPATAQPSIPIGTESDPRGVVVSRPAPETSPALKPAVLGPPPETGFDTVRREPAAGSPVADPTIPSVSRSLPEPVARPAPSILRPGPAPDPAPVVVPRSVEGTAFAALRLAEPVARLLPTVPAAPSPSAPATPVQAASRPLQASVQPGKPVFPTALRTEDPSIALPVPFGGIKAAPAMSPLTAPAPPVQAHLIPTTAPDDMAAPPPDIDPDTAPRPQAPEPSRAGPPPASVAPQAPDAPISAAPPVKDRSADVVTEPERPAPRAAARFAANPAQPETAPSKLPQVEAAESRQSSAPFPLSESPEIERGSQDSQRPVAQTPPPRAEMARAVAQQMTAAIAQGSDGTIDLRLSPEELGRVRLALSPGDLGVTVSITAERPETLDLVRRHIDLFAQDLRQSGFQNLAFTFGQDTRRGTPQMPVAPLTDEAPTSVSATLPAATPPRSFAATGRLDLRL